MFFYASTRSWAKIGEPVSKKAMTRKMMLNALNIRSPKNEKIKSKNRIII